MMGKRLFLLMVALLLCCTLAAALGEDALSGTCGTRLNWVLVDGTLTISGTGTMRNYTESSPAPWDGVKEEITAVILSEGAENVGDHAFSDCMVLRTVTLPGTVTAIGAEAFHRCYQLDRITLPAGLQTIGDRAFQSCSMLQQLTLPEGLTAIGEAAFAMSPIVKVDVPDSVTSLGEQVWENCHLLQSVSIGSGVTALPSRLFNRSELSYAVLSEGVKCIGPACFGGCTNLEAICLPASLTEVDVNAFEYCTFLQRVYYGGSAEQAAQLNIAEGNDALTAAAWIYNAEPLSPTDPSIDTLVLPADLTTLEAEALSGVGAQKIVVPDSVTAIGSRAFADCSQLRYLQLPNSRLTLADDMLDGCGDVIIICPDGSTARDWALEHGFIYWLQ